MDTNYFGNYLAKLRREKKLKQKQVAYEAGVDPSYVAALENGRRVPPRHDGVIKLAKAVNANDQETKDLERSARLSQLAKEIDACAEHFSGATVAMAILELSSVMSQSEIHALATLVDGYRYRAKVQGRIDM
jgi:transcriptional regulator with XRE-family HTH domain